MEAIAVIIILAAVGAGIFGLINLAKPLGFLRIRRRRHGAAVLGGSIVAFFLGGLLGAASQPGGLEAGRAKAAAEREAAEKAKPAPAPAPAPKPTGVTQAELNATWGATKVIMDQCDGPVAAAGQSLSGGDVYAAYPYVQRAEQACTDAMMRMSDLAIPRSAKGDVRKAFNDAKSACQTTAFIKSEAMKKVGIVVNGDTRPSAFTDAQAEMKQGQIASLNCVATFAKAAEAADLVLPEFQAATAEAEKEE